MNLGLPKEDTHPNTFTEIHSHAFKRCTFTYIQIKSLRFLICFIKMFRLSKSSKKKKMLPFLSDIPTPSRKKEESRMNFWPILMILCAVLHGDGWRSLLQTRFWTCARETYFSSRPTAGALGLTVISGPASCSLGAGPVDTACGRDTPGSQLPQGVQQ